MGEPVAYNKDQWISSFEDQLSILRPHLTPRVLDTMSLAAWHAHGRKDEDPIEAARQGNGPSRWTSDGQWAARSASP
jgi:hypothetical protein